MTGTFREETPLKFQVDLNTEVEEAIFEKDEEVEIVEEMDTSYLIKCSEGHYYHVNKDALKVGD